MATRNLKIQRKGDFYAKKTYPEIKLAGHWLREEAGIPEEGRVKITLVSPGKLMIELEEQKNVHNG
jgi:hypothetical protein